MIDWDNPNWGRGDNVTYASNGSWVEPNESDYESTTQQSDAYVMRDRTKERTFSCVS